MRIAELVALLVLLALASSKRMDHEWMYYTYPTYRTYYI